MSPTQRLLDSSIKPDLIASIAGVVSALALPPTHFVPILFVSIPILLGLIEASPSFVVALRRGWFFGFGLNLCGLYWITEAILIEADRFWWLVPVAVPSLAAVMAAFIALAAGASFWASSGASKIFALAGAWVLSDLSRQFVASGFPWNPLGSVWEFPGVVGDVFVQPAAWVGVHGLTLVTLLISGAPVLGKRGWAFAVLGLGCWAGLGTGRLNHIEYLHPSSAAIEVTLVQGNVSQGLKWDQAERITIFNRYLSLSRVAASHDALRLTRVVVWPETASPFLLDEDPGARHAIAAAVDGAWSLVGAIRFDAAGRARNSLLALTPDGAIAAAYDKWHLVPFGEYQPSWLPIGIQLVPGGGLQPGPGPRIIRAGHVAPFAPLICYEAIFSGQVVTSEARPEWIVNITNDAWFGNSAGPRQHLAAARMRAVEEGLPLVRAANTGISAVFDSYGHEMGRLPLGVSGTLTKPLPPALPPTPYSKFGLIVPAVAALLAFGGGSVSATCRTG